MSTDRRTFALAITGASGALYAMRTMAALLERNCHLEVVISDYGKRLLHDELGEGASAAHLREYLVDRYGEPAKQGSFEVLSNKDLGATIASGSHDCDAMVVVPCSMKTLAGIAHGLSRNLVERAADVMLKERRTLVLMIRESPLSLVHAENILALTRAGATVMPLSPPWYHRPRTLEDLVEDTCARALDHLGLPQLVPRRWTGEAAPR